MAAGDDAPKPISLFYSYSHKDERYREKLETQLKILQRQGVINGWHDRKIGAGKDWASEMDHHLEAAGIILLLISDNFLASDYCYGKEMMRALERHENGNARVIPIILSHCLWEDAPLAKLQALPRDAKPITRWNDRTEAYKSVAVGIRDAARALGAAAHPQPTPLREKERVKGGTEGSGFRGVSDTAPTLVRFVAQPPTRASLLSTLMHLTERERECLNWAAQGKDSWRTSMMLGISENTVSTLLKTAMGKLGATNKGQAVAIALRAGSIRGRGQRESHFGRRVRPFTDLEVFRDIDAPWCPEMVVIPKGEFLMGSSEDEDGRFDDEGPQHRVTIAYRFALGRCPVTFVEYDYSCGATGRMKPPDKGRGRGKKPVINVSWHDAMAYCDWLAGETGQPYYLPSEAEWEYGCRAGTTTRFSIGSHMTELDGNFAGKVGKTTEVGTYPTNRWGLYDMHGNVWEWCADHWHDSYQGAPQDGRAWTDPEGKHSSLYRVVRGGSCFSLSRVLRSAFHDGCFPGYCSDFRGFRVARTLD